MDRDGDSKTCDSVLTMASVALPAYVITLRPERLALFEDDCRALKCLNVVPATDGRDIDLDAWEREGLVSAKGEFAFANDHIRPLRRGELGCFRSHHRVWQRLVDEDVECALVFEDDAVVPDAATLNTAIEEAMRLGEWDIAYLSHNWHGPSPLEVGEPCLTWTRSWAHTSFQQTHAYLVTQRGARRLLEFAVPFRLPVDAYMVCRQDLVVWCAPDHLVVNPRDSVSDTTVIV